MPASRKEAGPLPQKVLVRLGYVGADPCVAGARLPLASPGLGAPSVPSLQLRVRGGRPVAGPSSEAVLTNL